MSFRNKDLNWFMVVVVCWTLLFTASAFERLAPASAWLVVHYVAVEDTTIGVPPRMEVNREIVRPFDGEWLVEVEEMNTNGRFIQDCVATGDGDYTPDNDLPVVLNLDWWTYPASCTPDSVGNYRVTTRWTIHLTGGLTKEVRAISNTFRVTAG